MEVKHLLLLIIICPTMFLGYFINPVLNGNDSYAFLTQICFGKVEPNLGSDIIFGLLAYLPCNVFELKLILCCLFTISVIAIAVFGENIVKEHGWKAGLYAATLSPLLFMEATKFENDFFGITLSFVGLALFTLPKKQLVSIDWLALRIVGLIACFLAVLLYSGSFLGVLALCLMSFLLIIVSIPIFYQVIIKNLSFLIPKTTNLIAEELPLVGIPNVILLFIAIFDLPKKIRLPGWALFIVGVIKSKLMVFSIPFLAVGMVELENKLRPSWKNFPNLSMICLVFVPVYCLLGFYTNPSQLDFAVLQEGIDLSEVNDEPLFNDWDIGWQLEYLGFDTNFKSSYPSPDYNNLDRPFYALTYQDLNCTLINSSEKLLLFRCL